MADIKKEVEAILFASGRVVLVKEFQALLRIKDTGVIVEAVKELMQEYEERDSPMMIVEEEDGWKLTVRERYLSVVHTINPHTELSKSVLETLAVIAWKQPMLQSNVIKIRTNKAYDHISELVSLGFITREKYGRSYLIKVTQKFLDYFDLPEPKAIKDMFKDFKDIEVAVKKKVGDSDKRDSQKGSEAKTEESDTSVPGLSPELEPVPAEGMDFDTFIDELPPMETPKTERHVETYDADSPGVVQEIEETPEEEKLEEEKLEEAEVALEKVEQEESPEEKAKRLAKEVLGEEQEEEKEEEEHEERKLHPKLEEFIQAEHEEKEKEAKEEVPEEEKEEGQEPEAAEAEPAATEEHGTAEEQETEDAEGQEPADDEEDRPKQAEEYPGQFSEQAGEEEHSEGDDPEKQDA